jgi:hypothetical protein
MSTRIRTSLCALAALTLVLAACGSSGGSKSSGTSPSSASSGGSGSSSSGSAKTVDACGLITDEEASAILGETVDRTTPTKGGGTGNTCEWHTPGSYSITIEVGDDGTAPNDELKVDPIMGDPKPAPALGDKGALLPGGSVYFAAGNRLNNVQVVSKTAGGADDQAAIDLAVKISPKIASGS